MKRLKMFFIKDKLKTLLIFIIYLLCFYKAYPFTMFLEYNALVNTNEINSEILLNSKYNPNNIFYKTVEAITQEYFSSGDKVYLVLDKNEYNEKKEIVKIIKSRFKNIKIRSRLFLRIHTMFFKRKSIIFLESEKLLNYAREKNIKYVLIINSINKLDDFNIENDNIIKLSFNDKNKIIITEDIREKIKIKIEKENIKVIDADTIKYDGSVYRLIGIDSPEITQSYGIAAKEFLEKLITNAKNVFIAVADFDIYGRILAHLFIDDKLASVYMIKERLSIQTITLYGNSGFVNNAQLIINEAVQTKKVSFTKPAKYRKTGVDKITTKTNPTVKIPPLRLTPQILMSNKED